MPASKSDSQQSIVIQLGGNGAITIQSSGKTTIASKVNIRSSLDELKQEALCLGCKEADLPKRKADLLQWIQRTNQTPQVATIQISDGTVTTSSRKTTTKSVAAATTKKAPVKKGATISKGKVPAKKDTTGSRAATTKPTKTVKQAATGTKATGSVTGKSPHPTGESTTTPNGKRPNDTLLVQWLNSGSKKPKTDHENDGGSDVGPKKTPATVLFPVNNATASSTAVKRKSAKKEGGTKPKLSATTSAKTVAPKGKMGTNAPQPTPVPVPSSNVLANPSASTGNLSTAATLPRINNKLTLSELQQEATARGHDKKSTPKLKSELLHFLLDGSIHLSKTKAYQDEMKLKAQIESERRDLYEKSLALKLEDDRKREEQRVAKQRKLDEEQRKRDEERNAARTQEIAKQEALHVHTFPLVHPHKFAKTSSLYTLGKSRMSTARCDVCRQFGCFTFARQPVWTCEKCDFDICQACFSNENRTHEEKEKALELKRQKQREAELRWEEERRAEELEEEIRWDATKQFSKSIISPDANHKRPEGSNMKGFTVYCSSGYDADGWHSYEGEPTKYFDTTWKTKKEANDRARYLFFWKNSYGVRPDEVEGNEGVVEERTSAEGMISFTVRPADSERWTVAVCPDQAYKYLDHASTSRHDHDDRDYSESSYTYYSQLMY